MGGDPAPQMRKTLTISYSLHGAQPLTIQALEGEELKLGF